MLINSAANTVCHKDRKFWIPDFKSARGGRFFITACLFAYTLFAVTAPATPGQKDTACNTAAYHETAGIKHVIDGDTVILADDRHVRLIGINAPEVGHDDEPSQPGAIEARNFLSKILRDQSHINLHYDIQRHDHYGRTLAHLFLGDGTNLQSLLLRQGLVTSLTIPPNLGFLACYQSSADFAYTHTYGIWSLPEYQPVSAYEISQRDLGYRIVTGTVLRVGESKSAIWLNLTPNVALRIARDDLGNFNDPVLTDLVGKEITARGWIQYRNREYRMRIRHPVDLNITVISNEN